MSTILVKIEIGKEKRRFNITEQTTYSDFVGILRQINSTLFNEENKQPVIQYKDEEGDWISVTTEFEWKECLAQHKKGEILRLKCPVEENMCPVLKNCPMKKCPEMRKLDKCPMMKCPKMMHMSLMKECPFRKTEKCPALKDMKECPMKKCPMMTPEKMSKCPTLKNMKECPFKKSKRVDGCCNENCTCGDECKCDCQCEKGDSCCKDCKCIKCCCKEKRNYYYFNY